MAFHPVLPSSPLASSILHHLALGSPLSEISNSPDAVGGAVRHHIFHHREPWRPRPNFPKNCAGLCSSSSTRPADTVPQQNGFRLCLVNRGFHIRSPDKDKGENEEEEDDIDRLEKSIDQGWMEVVILGDTPVYDSEEGSGAGGEVVFDDDDGGCGCEEGISIEDGRDDDGKRA